MASGGHKFSRSAKSMSLEKTVIVAIASQLNWLWWLWIRESDWKTGTRQININRSHYLPMTILCFTCHCEWTQGRYQMLNSVGLCCFVLLVLSVGVSACCTLWLTAYLTAFKILFCTFSFSHLLSIFCFQSTIFTYSSFFFASVLSFHLLNFLTCHRLFQHQSAEYYPKE